LITDHYMRAYGADRSDFGRLVISQRANARDNPNALLGHKPLSLDEYLDARPIAPPIHLYDCVMPCAGAEAFLVMSEDRARSLGVPFAVILGAIERHNSFADDPVSYRGGWALDKDSLYAQAGVGTDAIDCVQTYDDYPVISFFQLEDLGFCAKGEAADFVRRTDLSTEGGQLAHNTSGGQLACGQAGAAGGFLPVVETLRQLTRQPLGRQVPDARIGLASGYGMINYDRAICCGAVILGAAL
jgi:acetyl-CoA acetyltransferase